MVTCMLGPFHSLSENCVEVQVVSRNANEVVGVAADNKNRFSHTHYVHLGTLLLDAKNCTDFGL